MKNKFSNNVFVGQLEHRRGKKLSQRSTEFFHKEQGVRKPPRGGIL
jgi:hypothetical protein